MAHRGWTVQVKGKVVILVAFYVGAAVRYFSLGSTMASNPQVMSVFLGPFNEPQIYLRTAGRQKVDFFSRAGLECLFFFGNWLLILFWVLKKAN